jgi:predicted phosphodiesterase
MRAERYRTKMRLALTSDTHFEFGSQRPITLDRDVDVLVLAGDIDRWDRVPARAAEIANGHARHIVFVPGNHEYYGQRMDKVHFEETETFHPLLDSTFTLDGVKFAGGTLWTDYALDGNPALAMIVAENYLNDHRRIKMGATHGYRKFLPRDAVVLHHMTRNFIMQSGADIVVTHHAPTAMSVNAKYLGDSLNAAYASNLTPIGKLWMHGRKCTSSHEVLRCITSSEYSF